MTFGTGVKSKFFKAEFFLFFCFATVVLKSRHVVLLAAGLSGL